MSKKKSVRLAPLLKLEQNHEQEKARALGKARSLVVAEAEKLQQLVEYRSEYEKMVTEQGGRGISATRLQWFYQFINRLTAAITQQRQQLQLVRDRESLAQQQWFQQRGAVKRMDSLIERSVHEEHREEDKREQKMLDEQTQQNRYYRHINGFE